jgi:cephalosporin hydroxylase
MAGGGFANLELFERLGAAPGVTVSTILGEGSFHQLHGGTTTNASDEVERRRRISTYRRHFAETRGKDLRRIGKDFHYVGHMPRDAARTRARRRVVPNLFKAATGSDPDGFPEKPELIPDELNLAFTDAFWSSLGWQETSWLGHQVRKAPSDLIAYQELIFRLRPRWIIETRAGDGALAPFFASICDLLGSGHVLSVNSDEPSKSFEHPRVKHIVALPLEAATIQAVRRHVGDSPNVLVVLGSRRPLAHMMKEFTSYSPLVPVGGYLIVEDTIVGGHPVWPSFGSGPAEAVGTILNTGERFTADRSLERYGPTFNPRGYLRRVSR